MFAVQMAFKGFRIGDLQRSKTILLRLAIADNILKVPYILLITYSFKIEHKSYTLSLVGVSYMQKSS